MRNNGVGKVSIKRERARISASSCPTAKTRSASWTEIESLDGSPEGLALCIGEQNAFITIAAISSKRTEGARKKLVPLKINHLHQ